MVGTLCFLGKKCLRDNFGANKAVFRPFGLIICVLLAMLYVQIHGQFLEGLHSWYSSILILASILSEKLEF